MNIREEFREYLRESELNESKLDPMTFEILLGKEILFRSSAGNAADQVSNKLKTKKYQENLKDLKITRTSKYGYEDVTSLFIK